MCGNDAVLKAFVSKCFMGGKHFLTSQISDHILSDVSVCLMEDELLHGRLINLFQLPALKRLSEEEVMRETLNCVSFCDPGVHAFLLIVPVGPLTEENKAEIEKIQKIFDLREHFIVLFTSELTVNRRVTDLIKSSPESQGLISCCGGRYRMIGLNEPENSRQIPELLDYIENMKTFRTSEPYSLEMYVRAKENRARHETETVQLHGAGGQSEDQECLRIVLIGKTGNGKSATGNSILGRDYFVSELRLDSVTTVCEKRVGEVDGRLVTVVDTPGLFDTTLTSDQAVKEIMKCISMLSPGPHVFIIVLSLRRFTREEKETLDLIKKIFSPRAAQFSIVLFTGGDNLKNKSIEEYVSESNCAELKKLIRDCGNRFLVFNNSEKRDKTQVTRLLNKIEEVKNSNGGRYFTNSMFEEAEMSIKKIQKEREREIQAQNKALKNKCEMEMIRREEEKRRADKEKMKMQKQMMKERREREQEREQQKSEREQMKMMMADLQREKTELGMKCYYAGEIMWNQEKYEARTRAEEMYMEQIWALMDKLEEEHERYELLQEQFEILQDKVKQITAKNQRRNRCNLM